MRARFAALFFGAIVSSSGAARALTQPNGATIPAPMGCSGGNPTGLLPVLACACTKSGTCNIGAPCPGGSTSCDDGKHGTCEATLWHSPNDNACIPSNHQGLDPAVKAAVVPETFHPTCGQTFTVISRGTAQFHSVFGWYNATTKLPDPSDLHVMLGCTDAAGKVVSLDLAHEPAYKGGDIGFFLVTPEDHAKGGACASNDCCSSVARLQAGEGYAYFSQKAFDPDPGYYHLLNLPGTIAPNRFYFAWEDTFDTTSADFTDLVVAVDGVQCSGAGLPCSTGLQGACALGISACAGGSATPTCQSVTAPAPEVCNGVDDDCDGTVDNGATCPMASDVCVNGVCVRRCASLENPCDTGLVCDPTSGVCMDPKCVGVTCTSAQVCRAGVCATACNGVVCPHGQVCMGNSCVDLCARVACATGSVCVQGVCLPACNACGGATCQTPLACDDTTGACTDPSCAQTCPAGTYCSAGMCVDACQGVQCPDGQTCAAGECSNSGGGDAGGPVLSPPSPGAAGTLGADSGVTGAGVAPGSEGMAAGCACRTSPGGRGAWPGALVVVFALAVRRRRGGSRSG